MRDVDVVGVHGGGEDEADEDSYDYTSAEEDLQQTREAGTQDLFVSPQQPPLK